jgi:hypothetical protein
MANDRWNIAFDWCMLGVFVLAVLVGLSRLCLYSRAKRDKVERIARWICCPDGFVGGVIIHLVSSILSLGIVSRAAVFSSR